MTAYANGALVPTDTLSVQAAKAQHFAAKAAVAPFGYGYYGAHLLGKREAEAAPEADAQYFYGNPYFANPHTSIGLTAYANGALTPTPTLAVQQATAAHFAAKAAIAPYGYGYYGAHLLGKREAEAAPEADAQYFYGNPYLNPHTSIGLTAYANGAVTPTETLAVQQATAAHFAAKANAYATSYPYGYGVYGAGHYIGKREAEAEPEAEAQFLASPYGYGAYSAYRYPAYANYGFVNNYAYGYPGAY